METTKLVLTMLFYVVATQPNWANAKSSSSQSRKQKEVLDGLCTNANKSKPQVKKGYCAILRKVMSADGSCANTQLQKVLAKGDSLGGVGKFCSTYKQFNGDKFSAIYQFLAAAITVESSWDPNDTGDHGHSVGLFSISKSDAKLYPSGCKDIDKGNNIKNPEKNITCGACIALTNMAKDGALAQGTNGGMARYFGPWKDGQSVQLALKGALNQYCVASTNGSTQFADSGSGVEMADSSR